MARRLRTKSVLEFEQGVGEERRGRSWEKKPIEDNFGKESWRSGPEEKAEEKVDEETKEEK